METKDSDADGVVQIISSPLTRAIETTIGAFPDAKIPIIGATSYGNEDLTNGSF